MIIPIGRHVLGQVRPEPVTPDPTPIIPLDLAAAKKHRAAFGFFRDRRPELYGRLTQDV